jgi:hypothetical protein
MKSCSKIFSKLSKKTNDKEARKLKNKVAKRVLIILGSLFTSFPILMIITAVVLITAVMSAVAGSNKNNSTSGTGQLSDNVLKYESLVSGYCEQYQINDYTLLVLAVMQQESAGNGTDPMQCSECPYNIDYPQKPGSITKPDYSIQVGIQYIASCLKAANCKSPDDIQGISLALQGYNFGGGYISWALAKGGYAKQNAIDFSKMKAQQLGWTGYGDTEYVDHVLQYYMSGGQSSGAEGTFGYPILRNYTITSPYGYRSDPTTGENKLHAGIDFAAAYGTPIQACDSGTVIYAQFGSAPYGGYGNIVIVRHSPTLISMYAHCSKIRVKVGQTVKKGQVVADVGSTGENCQGNHCHFEIRVNNKAVDPMTYLKKSAKK